MSRVEITIVNDQSPGDVNELACDSAESDLLGFALSEQALIKEAQTRVTANSGQSAHVQDMTQMRLAATDVGLGAQTGARLADIRNQSSESSGLFGGFAAGEAVGGGEQGSSAQRTHPWDRTQMAEGSVPFMLAADELFELLVEGVDASRQQRQMVLHFGEDGR